MSASSRSRGRALQNARQVSYDEDSRYATESGSSAAYSSEGAAEARSILSGRGLY